MKILKENIAIVFITVFTLVVAMLESGTINLFYISEAIIAKYTILFIVFVLFYLVIGKLETDKIN